MDCDGVVPRMESVLVAPHLVWARVVWKALWLLSRGEYGVGSVHQKYVKISVLLSLSQNINERQSQDKY